MSSKMIVICLMIAAASALPAHNGYAYEQGVSGTIGSATVNEINYAQAPQASNVVHTTSVHHQGGPIGLGHGGAVNIGHGVSHGPSSVSTVSHLGGHGGSIGVGHGVGHGSSVTTVSSLGGHGGSVGVGHGIGHGSSVNTVSNLGGHGGSFGVGHGSSFGHGHGSLGQASVISHNVHGGHSGVSQFHGFPDAPNPLAVGVEYVRQGGNDFVEQNAAGFSEPIITKSFHTYSGPEEHSEKTAVHHINIGTPQKHFRVIYVKNPSSSSNRALIKAHVAPKEEKTVVYVLSKNQNELNVETEIDEPAPTQPSKPDVVFVKYQHPEEIAHLQDSVQAQYNAIPGVNQVVDEGLAPVRSVIGALGGGSDGYAHGGSIGGGIGGGYGSASGISNTYSTGAGLGGGNSFTQTSQTYSSGPSTYTSGGFGSASETVQNVVGNVGFTGGNTGFTGGNTGSSTTYTTTTHTGDLGSASTSENVYLPPSPVVRVSRTTPETAKDDEKEEEKVTEN